MAQSVVVNISTPKPMSFDGDLGVNWRRFKRSYELYHEASELGKKSAEIQAAMFMHCVGEEALEILDTLDLTDAEKKNYKSLKEKLGGYFTPKSNQSVESHRFNQRAQGPTEKFDNFLTDLRKLSANCEFGNLRDRLIRDRIVSGIYDQKVKDRLLRESDLTLTKAIDICKAAEQTDDHVKLLTQHARAMEVNEIKKSSSKQTVKKKTSKHRNMDIEDNTKKEVQRRAESTSSNDQGYRGDKINCSRCGFTHARKRCPAYGKQCRKCHKLNHFAKVCKNNIVAAIDSKQDSEVRYVIATIRIDDCNLDLDWFEKIKLLDFDREVKFKLDTGAHVNVIPFYIFNSFNLNTELSKTNVKISNYGGENLEVKGLCKLTVASEIGVKRKLTFFVVDTKIKAVPIIGIIGIQLLNLLQRTNELSTIESDIDTNFKDLFDGIGKIRCNPCDIKLKPDYEAVVVPCRRVAFGLIDPLKIELEKMLRDGIICKQTEPSEFVNPIVLVRKPDNTIRVCLDPQNLNSAIMREHFGMPTFEEITANMGRSEYFSVLDATGFWQIELSDEASKLTTFATPFGRYRFLRLPYGLSNAPEIFYRTFTEIFGDIDGVKIYIDDIIIYAKTKQEHDEILRKVLNRAREKGVKFNKKSVCSVYQK